MLETEECCAAAGVLSLLHGGELYDSLNGSVANNLHPGWALKLSDSDAIPKLLSRGRSGKWDLVAEALACLAYNGTGTR